MGKAYDEKLETYRILKEANPDEPLRFFAEEFKVNIGTVSRWNKALKKQSIQEEAIDELRAKIEKEMEAKYKGIAEDKERVKAEKAETDRRASENKREHFKRIFKECQKVDIYPATTVDVTWQGFRVTLIGGVKNTVPEVIAGVWRESQKAEQQSAQTIARFGKGQYLGKV